MKEVKIVTVKVHCHFARNNFDNLEPIIENMYRQGFEYKGYVPSEERGYGYTSEIKMIFDREY